MLWLVIIKDLSCVVRKHFFVKDFICRAWEGRQSSLCAMEYKLQEVKLFSDILYVGWAHVGA